jgi:hypothetical protein
MKRFKALQTCLAFMMLILSVFLITGCGSNNETGHWLPAPGKELVSIQVTPATASIPIGAPKQFIATAIYDNGTSADVTGSAIWTSGSTGVATVNSTSGLATGLTSGTAIITADYGGKSDSATLTVMSAAVTLSSIVVTPPTASKPIGLTQNFVATGYYSDSSNHDISASATWTSGSPGVATVVSPGLATGVTAGTAIITAAFGGKSGFATLTIEPATLVSITIAVTPNPASVPIGLTQQFVATGTYSNGHSYDISNAVIWTSSATGVATVVSPGIATGLSVGTTTITATLNCGDCYTNPSGSAILTVTAARLMSITVAPPEVTVDIGGKQTYVATGHYSDGSSSNISTSVVWSPGTPSVATVVSPGVATGLAQGTSHIIATLGALSGYGILNVNAAPAPPPPGTCDTGPLNLGSAASFAVLGGTALTVTNPTPVTGNVGSPAITPAIGPIPLTGTLYDSSPASELVTISDAVKDMQTAIGCALQRPCDFNYTVATDFSAVNAATLGGLVPGVYCVSAAMSVSSPVILTLVNPGVYIFRSTGALTSAPGVTVNLGGTATAANTSIFWISTGAASNVSIGATNVFLGTIMVGNLGDPGAATLGANTTLLGGRVLSTNAVTLNKNAITIP